MKPLALTLGDPAGIGPEITWKAWERLRDDPDLAFAVIAPEAALRHVSRADHPIRVISNIADASSCFKDALPILAIDGNAARPGEPDPIHADTITRSIQTAVTLCRARKADAVVTNPLSWEVADLDIKLQEEGEEPLGPYAPKPEIKHLFR